MYNNLNERTYSINTVNVDIAVNYCTAFKLVNKSLSNLPFLSPNENQSLKQNVLRDKKKKTSINELRKRISIYFVFFKYYRFVYLSIF